MTRLRAILRSSKTWIKFQELNREGWLEAFKRSQTQRQILNTPPIHTEKIGTSEVRVLTWRRDWINTLWSLKSFYSYSQEKYPLFIHDGGLERYQFQKLQEHFPTATIISKSAADNIVVPLLSERKLQNCINYRLVSPFGRRIIDFYLMSRAEKIISIDADVLFFQKPNEILNTSIKNNFYNRDAGYFYSMELSELNTAFGIKPIPLINAGLSLVWRESVDFQKIDEWLDNRQLFGDSWLTEQTIHALLSTIYGITLLPDAYALGKTWGLDNNVISKHYPSRTPLLYFEGMQTLIENGFLNNLAAVNSTDDKNQQ